MTDRELMQQALEALEVETAWAGPTPKGAAIITALRERLARQEPSEEYRRGWNDAMLRFCVEPARQEQEQEPVCDKNPQGCWNVRCQLGKVCKNTAPQPARQEQEPVAMRMPREGDRVICIEDDSAGTVQFTSAAGGPYIKFDDGSYGQWSLSEFGTLFRYAAAPTAREWLGLTDEEVRDLWSWSMTAEAERTANTQQHAFARAIEARLRERNS